MADVHAEAFWQLDPQIGARRSRRARTAIPFAVLGPHDTRRRSRHSRVSCPARQRSRSCAERWPLAGVA